MSMKRELLNKARLYVIFNPEDAQKLNAAPEKVVENCIRGGADIIQLRDKASSDDSLFALARKLKELCAKWSVLFIVNDRPQLAKDANADGVHLGQDDAPHPDTRKIVGTDMIIGRSTHSLDQAMQAQKEGADYIGVGPIFETPTKPDYKPVGTQLITQVLPNLRVPFFAIGAIQGGNIHKVQEAGASRVAVVRAALKTNPIETGVRQLKERLLYYATAKS